MAEVPDANGSTDNDIIKKIDSERVTVKVLNLIVAVDSLRVFSSFFICLILSLNILIFLLAPLLSFPHFSLILLFNIYPQCMPGYAIAMLCYVRRLFYHDMCPLALPDTPGRNRKSSSLGVASLDLPLPVYQ